MLYVSYDGTGVPVVPWETVGRKGKQKDGTSKTREVKLGCVFTQTLRDKKARGLMLLTPLDAATFLVEWKNISNSGLPKTKKYIAGPPLTH